jgi:hypothetical protein
LLLVPIMYMWLAPKNTTHSHDETPPHAPVAETEAHPRDVDGQAPVPAHAKIRPAQGMA